MGSGVEISGGRAPAGVPGLEANGTTGMGGKGDAAVMEEVESGLFEHVVGIDGAKELIDSERHELVSASRGGHRNSGVAGWKRTVKGRPAAA